MAALSFLKPKGKISSKISMSIIITNLIVLIIIASIVGYLINTKVGVLSNNLAVQQVEANLNLIEQDFEAVETAVQTMVPQVIGFTDVESLRSDTSYHQELDDMFAPVIKLTGERLGITRSIYMYYNVDIVGDEFDIWFYDNDDGKGFVRQPPAGIEYYDEYHAWYDEPVYNRNTLWTFPYLSETGSLITSYTTPVEKNGEVIGVVGMDLYLDDISEKLNEIRIFESGYVYFMNSKGDMIVHPKFDWNEDGTPVNLLDLGDYEQLLSQMNESKKGFCSIQKLMDKSLIQLLHILATVGFWHHPYPSQKFQLS